MRGFREVPLPGPDEARYEELRKAGFEAATSMHFHEVAIEDPFEAEREYEELGRLIVQILGFPEGVRLWEPDPDEGSA